MNPDMLLVGGGKMGAAIARHASLHANICIVDPVQPSLENLHGVTWLSAPDKLDPAFHPDIIVIAIKPQQMATALPAYARFRKSVFLSVMGGQTIENIKTHLGADYAIVRAMPNLPASIGQGMTVAVVGPHVAEAQKSLCERILRGVGELVWIENESWMNAITALSGSGPAYVFALAEAMAKAGEGLGLPPELAAQLARQTVIGSGGLLDNSEESAEALRVAVTSPGGTTEAALKYLLGANGLPDLIQKAMQAAADRAKELAR